MFQKFAGALVVAFLVAAIAHGAKTARFPGSRLTDNVAIQHTLRSEAKVLKAASNEPILKSIAKGLRIAVPVAERAKIAARVSPRILSDIEETGRAAGAKIDAALKAVRIKDLKITQAIKEREPFGPHQLSSKEARRIGRIGAMFSDATSQVVKKLKLTKSEALDLKGIPELRPNLECPFNIKIKCNTSAEYRTIDGSCNNLQNALWGRANTPFERFVAPQYDNGYSTPRQTSLNFGSPLPNPRVISTSVHQASTLVHIDYDISHMCMEFGQLVSHDINRNTLSSAYGGGSLVCCNPDGSVDNDLNKKRLGCLPIEIPSSDPHFGPFNRTCMNFVRAVNTPDINCNLGSREQLSQVTHYLDASAVYGSDVGTTDNIRKHVDGLLKTLGSSNGDLLPQNPASTGTPGCRTTGSQHCFKAGDVRANQQPALVSMHTLFMREHNRVARELKLSNPTWDDERLFQETRKIISAELQHVAYNEYLPTVLGDSIASAFGFSPQSTGTYYSGYDDTVMAAVRNGFAAAGYRFGHSTVRDHFAPAHLFKDHFLKPEVLYDSSKGPSYVIQHLFQSQQQKMDRYMSTQLTNHLFERVAGGGADLAALNIQRGRDHGLANYNLWRLFCGLNPATHFGTGVGGLVDHDGPVALVLQSTYSHIDDVDLWTGLVTEKPVAGGVVGPTGACIIGRQFWILKNGDRFFYENDKAFVKFSIEELNEIRKTSLARIICDNTDTINLQRQVLKLPSPSNQYVNCDGLPKVDLTQWGPQCIDGGWSGWIPWTGCFSGKRFRFRRCNNPRPNHCGKPCSGKSYWITSCRTGGIAFPRRFKPGREGIVAQPKISQTVDVIELMKSIAPEGVVIQ